MTAVLILHLISYVTTCQQKCCGFPRQYVYGPLIDLNLYATSIDKLKVTLEKAHQLEQSKEQQSLSINLPVAQCYSYLPWYSQQVWTMSESGDILSALNSQHENLLYDLKLFLCLSILSWYFTLKSFGEMCIQNESEQMQLDFGNRWLQQLLPHPYGRFLSICKGNAWVALYTFTFPSDWNVAPINS